MVRAEADDRHERPRLLVAVAGIGERARVRRVGGVGVYSVVVLSDRVSRQKTRSQTWCDSQARTRNNVEDSWTDQSVLLRDG